MNADRALVRNKFFRLFIIIFIEIGKYRIIKVRRHSIGENEAKESFRNRIQSIFHEKENVGILDDAGSSNSEKKQYGVGNCAANLAE